MFIATTNSKGGVGKSTIAVHLAAWLHGQGKHVIVIDCDTQQSCSRWLNRVNVEIPTVQMGTPDEVFKYGLDLVSQADFVIADGQGKHVIVIDCDTQQSCSRWLNRVNVEIPTVQMGTPDEVFKYGLDLVSQ